MEKAQEGAFGPLQAAPEARQPGESLEDATQAACKLRRHMGRLSGGSMWMEWVCYTWVSLTGATCDVPFQFPYLLCLRKIGRERCRW